MSNEIHLSPEYKQVVALAAKHDIHMTVAGGYPRDLHFGRTPKDLDIIVCGNTEYIDWLGFRLDLDECGLLVNAFDESEAPSASGDPRVREVMKIQGNIDIVLWNAPFMDITNVLGNFDFNINQFIMLGDTSPMYLPSNSADFGTLTVLDGAIIPAERYEKNIKLANELNWDTKECQKILNTLTATPIPALNKVL
ncbi:MAG: hypothetical protein HRT61_00670 [Ekhidna sp.]|nr:hypothetical protein [Ekhidna sp.]